MKTTSFFVNILMKLHKVAVKTLAIPTMKRNMPILTFILSQFFNVLLKVQSSFEKIIQ